MVSSHKKSVKNIEKVSSKNSIELLKKEAPSTIAMLDAKGSFAAKAKNKRLKMRWLTSIVS